MNGVKNFSLLEWSIVVALVHDDVNVTVVVVTVYFHQTIFYSQTIETKKHLKYFICHIHVYVKNVLLIRHLHEN